MISCECRWRSHCSPGEHSQPDGVILFSDILTPLTGMNIPFDISAGKGPIIHDPIRTMEVRMQGCALCPLTTLVPMPRYFCLAMGWPVLTPYRSLIALKMSCSALSVSRVCSHLCELMLGPIQHVLVTLKLHPSMLPKMMSQRNDCVALQQVNQVTRLDAEEATPYVGEALRALRAEVGNQSVVLGFVGAPLHPSVLHRGGRLQQELHPHQAPSVRAARRLARTAFKACRECGRLRQISGKHLILSCP